MYGERPWKVDRGHARLAPRWSPRWSLRCSPRSPRSPRLGRWLGRLASRQSGRVVALHVGRGYLGLRELKSTRVPRRLTRLRHEAAVDSFTANWLNENQLFYRFSAEPVTCRGTDHYIVQPASALLGESSSCAVTNLPRGSATRRW